MSMFAWVILAGIIVVAILFLFIVISLMPNAEDQRRKSDESLWKELQDLENNE